MYRNQFTVTDTAPNTEILRAVYAGGISPVLPRFSSHTVNHFEKGTFMLFFCMSPDISTF